MADPDHPALVGVYTSTFETAHRSRSTTERGLLFCNGTRKNGVATGMRILSLQDPASPVEVGWWPGGQLAREGKPAIEHDGDPVLRSFMCTTRIRSTSRTRPSTFCMHLRGPRGSASSTSRIRRSRSRPPRGPIREGFYPQHGDRQDRQVPLSLRRGGCAAAESLRSGGVTAAARGLRVQADSAAGCQQHPRRPQPARSRQRALRFQLCREASAFSTSATRPIPLSSAGRTRT